MLVEVSITGTEKMYHAYETRAVGCSTNNCQRLTYILGGYQCNGKDYFFVFGMQMVPNIGSFIRIVCDFLEETDILVGTGSCDNQASGIVRTTDVIVEL